jgi:hypothetical protein
MSNRWEALRLSQLTPDKRIARKLAVPMPPNLAAALIHVVRLRRPAVAPVQLS